MDFLRKEIQFLFKLLQSFLNIQEKESLFSSFIKTIYLILRRCIYFLLDYGLAFISAALVVWLNVHQFSLLSITAILWLFDFVTAALFIFFYEKTKIDLTLGEDFRRAVDTLKLRSQFFGKIAFIVISLEAIIWTGPERIVIFFRHELKNYVYRYGALIFLTLLQAIIWTLIYSGGYSLFSLFF